MGIVSSAKLVDGYEIDLQSELVSIPDGDSFLREVDDCVGRGAVAETFQSPMGIVSSAKPK